MSTAHNGGSSHDGPRLVAAILIIPVAVAIVLSLFAWPAANLAPRDLPIGIAGPAQAVAAIEQQLALAGEEAGEGENAFDVHQYADEAEARAAIEGREIYGALVATPEGATVLTASAASPLVAQLLQQAAAPQDAGAPAPQVVDVVPIDEDDPRALCWGRPCFRWFSVACSPGSCCGRLRRPGPRARSV